MKYITCRTFTESFTIIKKNTGSLLWLESFRNCKKKIVKKPTSDKFSEQYIYAFVYVHLTGKLKI
jgi:hypothetical protein